MSTQYLASVKDPWFNELQGDEDDQIEILADTYHEAREAFFSTLTNGLAGATYTGTNLYIGVGFGRQGIRNWDEVERDLAIWCDMNDKRHGGNWIFMTHGDPEYFKDDVGIKSIASVAQYVQNRGIPVVCLQSHFAYAEPGDPNWPNYASAVLFGLGKYNTVKGMSECCYGGRVTNDPGNGQLVEATGEISFPDEALMLQRFGPDRVRLLDGLGGLFIAGGGDTTRSQAEMYHMGSRETDMYSPAISLEGNASTLASLYIAQHPRVVALKAEARENQQ